MSRRHSSWLRLQRPLSEERGQALVLAMVIVLVGLLLGLAAVGYALSAGQQGAHDQQRRAAQQASDAGVQQQIFQQSSANAIGFNATAGSLGNLLECVESNLGVSAGLNASTTLAQVALTAGGACPQQTCTKGTANCSTGTTPTWSSLDNEDYYDAEFCPNAEYQSSSGTPTAACTTPATATTASTLAVEFPEIVSVGCHSAPATCDTGASTNQYFKQLALLNPTAPLQAIEGENNVRINDTSEQTCASLSILGICLSVSLNGSPVSATIIDGNIVAGNALQLPTSTLGLSTTTAGNLVSNVVSGLSSLLSLLGLPTTLPTTLQQDLGLAAGEQPVSLSPTYEYGNCYGTSVSPSSGTSSPSSSYSCSGTPASVNGNFVNTGLKDPCTAGSPSTKCTLIRPSFSLGASTAATPVATLTPLFSGTLNGGSCSTATSTTLASGGAGNCYENGDLSLTSGTLALTPGTYVFCNVYVGTNATLSGPSGSTGGAVQIYVLSPGSSQCSGSSTGARNVEGTTCTSGSDTEGNFNVPGGLTNSLKGTVNGLASTVDPSNFQIYVAGDTSDSLAVNSNCQPRTAVTIGGSTATPDVLEAFTVYAPESNVSVSTDLSFEGSAIGWNVNLTALAIVQDLNLGNYPLSSVVDSYQPAQTLSCAATNTELTSSAADLTGC